MEPSSWKGGGGWVRRLGGVWVRGIANIGSVLHEKALSGDIRAIQFYQGGWTEKYYIELFKAEEPVDRHWTIKVMGASICPNCGVDHAR